MTLTLQEACDALAQGIGKQLSELTGIPQEYIAVCLLYISGGKDGNDPSMHMSTDIDRDTLGGLFLTWLNDLQHQGKEIPPVQ